MKQFVIPTIVVIFVILGTYWLTKKMVGKELMNYKITISETVGKARFLEYQLDT